MGSLFTYKNNKRVLQRSCLLTAAKQTYADLVIDKIDSNLEFFKHKLYSQHCFKLDEIYVKDLRIIYHTYIFGGYGSENIEDRALEDMLIIDNSILSFAAQLDN